MRAFVVPRRRHTRRMQRWRAQIHFVQISRQTMRSSKSPMRRFRRSPPPPTHKSLKTPRLANKIRAKTKLRLSNATMAHLTKSHAANCSMSRACPKFVKVANASSTQPLDRAPCHLLPLANKIRAKTKIRLSNATMERQPKSHAMKSSTTMANRRSATMAHVSRHSAQKTFAAIAKRS